MADLVGIRVLVPDTMAQIKARGGLTQLLSPGVKVIDYRSRSSGYRSIHIIYKREGKLIEIQLRTLPQHLWAVESEYFGQTVKEGGGNAAVRGYLDDELAPVCKAVDEGSEDKVKTGPLFKNRAPINRILRNMHRLFVEATRGFSRPRG